MAKGTYYSPAGMMVDDHRSSSTSDHDHFGKRLRVEDRIPSGTPWPGSLDQAYRALFQLHKQQRLDDHSEILLDMHHENKAQVSGHALLASWASLAAWQDEKAMATTRAAMNIRTLVPFFLTGAMMVGDQAIGMEDEEALFLCLGLDAFASPVGQVIYVQR